MKRAKGFVMLFFIAMLVIPSSLQASEQRTTCRVEYGGDRLTVEVENVSLGTLLERIRKETGIDFEVGQAQSQRLISLQFGPLPLEEGLRRVLSGFNYAFLLNADNRLAKVAIVGSVEPGKSDQPVASDRIFFVTTGSKAAQSGNVQSAPVEAVVESRTEGDVKGVTSLTGATAPGAPASGSEAHPLPMPSLAIQPAGQHMIVQPSAQTMVIHPSGETQQMIVLPPAATMDIKPPSAEGMPVKRNK